MASKISELPAGVTLTGSELVPIVQSGVTVQTTPADFKTLALNGFSANGLSLGAAANYAAMRTLLDLEAGTDFNAYTANLAALSAQATTGIMDRTGAGTYTTRTLDTDGTLAANSDTVIATQKAVKTYVDAAVGSGGTVTHTAGALTLNQLVFGNGSADLKVGDLTGDVTTSGGTATTIGALKVATGMIQAGAVTLAKIANAAANSKLLGSGAAGSGSAYTELTLGTGLSFSGTTLNVSGFVTTGAITGSGLTMATARLLGRTTASSGAVEEITVSTGLTFSATTVSVNFASTSDLNTGTDTTKAINSDVLAGSTHGKRFIQLLAGTDYTTALATGDGKAYWSVPSEFNGWNLVGVFAANVTRSSSGLPTFQIARVRAGTPADMLSTKVTIDANEYDSSTAATAAVIDTGNDDLNTGDFLRLDCDVTGTSTAGATVTLIIQLP